MDELSIHVRAHFYVYSKDLRFLPTSDLEETLEFLACVAHGSALDDATKLVVLDSLNTFVEEPDSISNTYAGFANQKDLDTHCAQVAENQKRKRQGARCARSSGQMMSKKQK
jgi:hypothetical protein